MTAIKWQVKENLHSIFRCDLCQSEESGIEQKHPLCWMEIKISKYKSVDLCKSCLEKIWDQTY